MNDTAHGYLRQTITALVALSLFLSVLGPVGIVAADPSVSVEQTADSTTVAPGETVTLTTTLAAEDVNGPLVEMEFPDGWEGTVTDSDGGAVRPQDTSGNVLPSNSPSVVWLSAGTYEVTTEVEVPEDAAPGDYTISTTGSGVDPTDDDGNIVNEDDEIDSTETTITVEEPDQNEEPSASFTASPSSPEAGETVSFDASGSSDGDGSLASYEWEFGDGETATGESPTHTYDASGDYDVTLTVTDDDGATDQATQTVSVSEVPNQDPTASISGPSSAQVDEQVSFDASGSSDADGSIESYEWEFGDGETATGASASHTYDAAGDYTVSVTVTDDDDATDTATQTVSVSEAATPASFQLSNLNVESPVTQGDTSTVTATVENVGDEEGTQTVALDVDNSETDTESVTLAAGASQQMSFDVDTTGLSVGDHDVALSTDDDSASATLSVTEETPANQDPSAAFDVSPSDPVTDETVTFDASASTDDSSIESYEWDLGDGETASGESVTHAYDTAGDYDVTLTVTDDDGATDTATQTVSVSEPAEPEPGLSTGVSLSPSEELVGVNGTTTFDVMVDNADSGVGAYTFTVSTSDAGVASITELELADSADGAITDIQYASDNSSVTVEAVLVDTEDTGEVTLGTVVVEGDSEGETDVDLSVDLLGDEAGDAYEVTAENGATLTVSELVVGGAEQPAQDLDDDGVYEDVNGDGEVNELDVQLLFAERNSGIVQGSPEAFDFNDDGKFDNLDIQKLYFEEVA